MILNLFCMRVAEVYQKEQDENISVDGPKMGKGRPRVK